MNKEHTMRRMAAVVAAAALVVGTAGCSSSKKATSSAIPTTSAPSPLALWLDSLSPPLEGFSNAQTDFVNSLLGDDLTVQKTAAQKAAVSAKAFSDALKAAPTAPAAAKQVQKAEGLLDQLTQVGASLGTCTTNCDDILSQFTTIFTDATTATNQLQTEARPPAKPGTTVPVTVPKGGTTSTTSATGDTEVPGAGQTPSSLPDDPDAGPTVTTVPPTPELTNWVKKYGNHVVNTAKALGTLATAIDATDISVVESACASFINSVNLTDSDPIAPNRTVASALATAMSYTRTPYAACADDPDIRDTTAEDGIRDSLYAMGAVMPNYLDLIF